MGYPDAFGDRESGGHRCRARPAAITEPAILLECREEAFTLLVPTSE